MDSVVSLDTVLTTAEELQDLLMIMTTEEMIEMIDMIEMIEKDQTGIITIAVIQVQMEVVPTSIIQMVIATQGAMQMPKEKVVRKSKKLWSCGSFRRHC